MTLFLVSNREIVTTIFKLVCKKAKIKLSVFEDILDIEDKADFIIVDEIFLEKVNNLRKKARKIGVITNKKLSLDYSVNFTIPNPFLPTILIDILAKEIQELKEEDEIIKFKNKIEDKREKNPISEIYKKSIQENEEDDKDIQEEEEELVENIVEELDDTNFEEDYKKIYKEEYDNEEENIKKEPPVNFNLEIKQKIERAQKTSHQTLKEANENIPYFASEDTLYSEEVGYHSELNSIVENVAEELNDDSKLPVAEIANSKGGVLDINELKTIKEIVNSNEFIKKEEIPQNDKDLSALSEIIDKAISDISSIDDVMEEKGFSTTNVIYLKEYDVNDLRPLLVKVNPMLIDNLKNGIPVKLELRLKRN